MRPPLPTLLTAIIILSAAPRSHCGTAARVLEATAATADGYTDIDSVEARMAARPLLPLEGVWELTTDGAAIAIERMDGICRDHTSAYRITVISMPDRSIPPGTVMGVATETADRRKFDARIYTRSTGERLSSPADFIISLDNDNSRLSMSHYRRGLKVNLWRMVPYMFRYSVGLRDERPRDLDGMVKTYPRQRSTATFPRYL